MRDINCILILIMDFIIHIPIFLYTKEDIVNVLIRTIEIIIHIGIASTVVINLKKWNHREKTHTFQKNIDTLFDHGHQAKNIYDFSRYGYINISIRFG